MTAPLSIWPSGDRPLSRAEKSNGPTTSASLAISDTAYHQIITYTRYDGTAGTGGWLDIGGAPGIDVTFAWTKGSGTLLTVLAIFANAYDRTADPTIGGPPAYIPAVAASGVTPVYANELTFSTTDHTSTTNPLSTTNIRMLRAYLHSNGSRLVELYVKSDNGSGSVIAYVNAGTQV